ncbi:MAG: NYN domain-containing protein [Acidobacteria bacterium]|nr:NYN domain-containing protein [Acidobacteriota bacterium]
MIDTGLKIAVFIDFDNIEIGVKTTLNLQLDIAAVLEGVKERGEIVTKVAYGDWKRAGEYGRLLSQHAIRMVQRTVTPGGDKNGADINLALDALEMAFTHHHINAFVIVGGDSDFITLVEKLKQYDKKVFVVGGRQFTSLVMQRNCHEFIAYENLVGGRRPPPAERRQNAPANGTKDSTEIEQIIPLVKRALKVLADREVSPQLGLLKSTLLQLDSTFSERNYGSSTFRDFVEKISKTGAVTLRHSGRNIMVDLPESADATAETAASPALPGSLEAPKVAPPAVDPARALQTARHVRDVFAQAGQPPRWPMYVRQLKQYLRALDPGFDEQAAGQGTLTELLRVCQREGIFRLERDRRGQMRIFPGSVLQATITANESANATLPADTTGEMSPPVEEVVPSGLIAPAEAPARARRARKPGTRKRAARKTPAVGKR